jgi:hypothetical protein
MVAAMAIEVRTNTSGPDSTVSVEADYWTITPNAQLALFLSQGDVKVAEFAAGTWVYVVKS